MDYSLVKNIQNPHDTPWLSWIMTGEKKFEGRLYRGDWKKLKLLDKVLFVNGNIKVGVMIVGLLYYTDFVSAYHDMHSSLIPGPWRPDEEVHALYNRYFTDEEVQENGVVLLKLKVIEISDE